MKKLFYLAFIFLLFTTIKCYAGVLPENIYVVTESDLNTSNVNINKEINFLSFDNYEISDTIKVNKGDKITVKPIEYKKPKRAKRNGYYIVQLMKITNNEETLELNKKILCKMRPSTPKDFKEFAESAGVKITGHILKVPGFSQVVAASKGIIKPNEGQNRLVSAGKNIYESTPLTYIEKGEDFSAEKDSVLVLKFRYNKKEDKE